ncbi:serine/threonine-protein kinase [Streptomyces hainanensis]|uniref:Serine/threonine protein kinase n=1 Tax=Streptomyces hainanensis TaxID=402648 RepID=A0A4R4TIL7_9ACTN|nr:serine/threonine-protein kinase [Streptomyces hainanensis]TDC75112.1 serine/threonine protein kinase [Streptomyces hainanensis]
MTGAAGQDGSGGRRSDATRFRELGDTDPRQVGRYRIQSRLGSGGMGSVYLSFTPGGQPVALKVVRAEFADDPEFRRRFAHEVAAAHRVQGVYTVPVLDFDTEGAAPWLATAYVPGLSLGDVIRDHGPLPVETVLLLAAGVAEALQSIHAAGIVHRDLKPGNVLLSGDGPKVIDFGIAQAADGTALTGTDVRVGTPAFMAPEQIMGTPAVSAATDVFALGVLIHFAATGGHPFGMGSAHSLMYRIVQEAPDVSGAPAALRGLIGACLAKDPAARPSPGQVIESCRQLSPGQALARHDGWLPAPAEAEVTRLRQAGPPMAGRTPTAVSVPPTPPPPTTRPAITQPAITQPIATPSAPGGRRRLALLLTATAVAATLVGAVLGARLLGGDSGDGSDGRSDTASDGETGAPDTETSPGNSMPERQEEDPQTVEEPVLDGRYEVVQSDVALPIRAPAYREDTNGTTFGHCYGANLTLVGFDTLTVETSLQYGNSGHITDYAQSALQYMFCDDEQVTQDGISFTSDLFVGTTEDRAIGAEGCYEAAHSSPLPNPVSPEDIVGDTVLRENMGICVETRDGAVVLLWIDSVEPDPTRRDMRSYITTATQWLPAE